MSSLSALRVAGSRTAPVAPVPAVLPRATPGGDSAAATLTMVEGVTLEGKFMLGEADADGNRALGLMSADIARGEHLFACQSCGAR